ncbi:hypothetical protein NOF04DRAFT_1312963 [Fusarium oxysporum II5]|nr:hypothetical protein NOF04DRAFT_1312963 [Fusarium oxysporum II5]
MDEDCLAVLHNIGHGGRIVNPSRNREELHLSQSHVHIRRTSLIQDPMIDFNRLRHRIFDPSPSNVLILLDCCHAASGSMGQRHDLIAASRFVDVDTQYVPQSFTENVVRQLEHAYNQEKILIILKLYN